MQVEQAIKTPFGINVFGSSTVRVSPDLVSLSFSVSSTREHPKDAFHAARETTRQVQDFLVKAQIKDAGSSRVGLEERYEYKNSEHQFVGYKASVEFRVLLYDLSRTEELLSGIVDAGASHIHTVEFQTTRLKALRLDARQKAIAEKKKKAEVYASAAGVELGEVIHIEDVNPDMLRQTRGHVQYEIEIEDEGQTQAFDPGSIVVSGAVMMSFKIRGS